MEIAGTEDTEVVIGFDCAAKSKEKFSSLPPSSLVNEVIVDVADTIVVVVDVLIMAVFCSITEDDEVTTAVASVEEEGFS